ncbi:MAG: gliding motility protein GldL [Chlorobi bacterium]|nr:gliding motility protein GldL [Chlorobiota bacterium]
MRKLIIFFETEKGKRVKNAIVGAGASVVLLGALFKIMHWPGAGLMLTIGMITEAFIFFFQGVILPPHKDYYWEKIFPGLDISPEVEEAMALKEGGEEVEEAKPLATPSTSPSTSLANLSSILSGASIPPETMEKLESAIEKLQATLSRLTNLGDAAIATEEYTKNVQAAAKALAEMKAAYEKAATVADELAQTADSTTEFRQSMQLSAEKLRALNEAFEQEIREVQTLVDASSQYADAARAAAEAVSEMSNSTVSIAEDLKEIERDVKASAEHTGALSTLYQEAGSVASDLEAIAEATKQYKEGMKELAANVKKLSKVYGNMVSALNVQE